MNKFKYFLIKNKMIVIISIIILICAIAITIGVYAQITNRKVLSTKETVEEIDYNELEINFDNIFTNNINSQGNISNEVNYDDIIYLGYDLNGHEAGYNINAKIPLFKIENEDTKVINKEIYNNFVETIIKIINSVNINTTFNVDYVAYINGDIISLVIRCKYKSGSNPQRIIIQTYNYNLKNNKLVNIDEIIEGKNLNKKEMQKRVSEKIKQKINQNKTIIEQGYNVYLRDENDENYKIENTPNFFLGENNILYLVYAYGNNNYTSEMDLVLF